MNSVRIYAMCVKFARLCRGWRLRAWSGLWGGHIDLGVEIEKGLLIRWGPHSGLRIENGVYLGKDVIIDVPRGASLTIGASSKIMHGSLLAASQDILIGRSTQIAEYCSVRDSDHDLAAVEAMSDAPVVSASVNIGDDVWIGRGAAILKGSKIGRGAVIGANAVVRGEIPERAIAVGIPARVMRKRE